MPISDSSAPLVDAAVSSHIAEARERIAAAVARGGHSQSVTLIAVTKTHGPEAVVAAWNAGVTDVGENRVQEAEMKMAAVDVPVRWHLIGHLQRNKAKSALRFSLVHGLDSERLAESLDQAAATQNVILDVLVQMNISGEATKNGLSLDDLSVFSDRLHQFSHLRVMGAMTMAPFDAEESILRKVFSGLRAVRSHLQQAGHPAPYLSMGMSGDFEVAIEEGATHVRLGTMLFGSRS